MNEPTNDGAVTSTAPQPSYYQLIGGTEAVKEAVDRLYTLILEDTELEPYFAHTDISRLKAHMAALLTKVLGGPDGYAGKDLAEAHRGLGITEAHYMKVCTYLDAVLYNLCVSTEIIEAVGLTLAKVQGDIVAPKTEID